MIVKYSIHIELRGLLKKTSQITNSRSIYWTVVLKQKEKKEEEYGEHSIVLLYTLNSTCVRNEKRFKQFRPKETEINRIR